MGTILGAGLGIGPLGAGLGEAIAWSMERRATVFAAAPFHTKRILPLNVGFTNAKAPPEYSKVTFVKEQLAHSKPSKGWMTPENEDPMNWLPRSGGTTGADPSLTTPRMPDEGEETAGCARIEVWLPKRNTNIIESLTTRDPNATVTLDITPPLSEPKGCLILRYHEVDRPLEKPLLP